MLPFEEAKRIIQPLEDSRTKTIPRIKQAKEVT
jgi:hypothetical protein